MLDQSATVLSGGEKQKLALARALVTAPQVLFLNEPCANLDGRAKREIEAILQEARAAGTRIVMSTHDIGQARRLASEFVLLHEGKTIESGAAKVLLNAPTSKQAAAFFKGDFVI